MTRAVLPKLSEITPMSSNDVLSPVSGKTQSESYPQILSRFCYRPSKGLFLAQQTCRGLEGSVLNVQFEEQWFEPDLRSAIEQFS